MRIALAVDEKLRFGTAFDGARMSRPTTGNRIQTHPRKEIYQFPHTFFAFSHVPHKKRDLWELFLFICSMICLSEVRLEYFSLRFRAPLPRDGEGKPSPKRFRIDVNGLQGILFCEVHYGDPYPPGHVAHLAACVFAE